MTLFHLWLKNKINREEVSTKKGKFEKEVDCGAYQDIKICSSFFQKLRQWKYTTLENK